MTEQTIKDLIKEMERRAAEFERSRDLYGRIGNLRDYWDGKRSEAAFMVEKLKMILEEGG